MYLDVTVGLRNLKRGEKMNICRRVFNYVCTSLIHSPPPFPTTYFSKYGYHLGKNDVVSCDIELRGKVSEKVVTLLRHELHVHDTERWIEVVHSTRQRRASGQSHLELLTKEHLEDFFAVQH